MFHLRVLPLVLCALLKLAHPVITSSVNETTSEEISVVAQPHLVNNNYSPAFVPTVALFLPENAVTSDAILIEANGEEESSVEQSANAKQSKLRDFRLSSAPVQEEERGIEASEFSIRPPAHVNLPDQPDTTSWSLFDTGSNEADTESAPTTTPEEILPTQAIPIESYVFVDRQAKSNGLLLPGFKWPYSPTEKPIEKQSLDLITKNITTDPEDLENALFNDTIGSSSAEVVESSQEVGIEAEAEASNESEVTDADFVTKEIPSSAAISTTTTTTTNLPPTHPVNILSNLNHRKKQPKFIKKFRASASEVLRYFMEGSYLRSPLAVLVDTSEKTLEKTKILWNATLQQTTTNIDMVLVTFDDSGIHATYKFNNSRTLVAGLNSIQPSAKTDQTESAPPPTDNVFSTIIRASERIPYDSAIFLFTNSNPAEDAVARNAALMLLKKRIRLYLFWFGGGDNVDGGDNDLESTSTASAGNSHHNQGSLDDGVAGILGEVTIRTGGEIVYMAGEAIHPNGEIGTVTLQLRNTFQGVHPFGVVLSDSDSTNLLKSTSHESSEEMRGVPLTINSDPREETSSTKSNNSSGEQQQQQHVVYPRSSNAKGG